MSRAWEAGWWAGLAVGLVTGAALVVLLLPSTPAALDTQARAAINFEDNQPAHTGGFHEQLRI